jgi:hypothetical protein
MEKACAHDRPTEVDQVVKDAVFCGATVRSALRTVAGELQTAGASPSKPHTRSCPSCGVLPCGVA